MRDGDKDGRRAGARVPEQTRRPRSVQVVDDKLHCCARRTPRTLCPQPSDTTLAQGTRRLVLHRQISPPLTSILFFTYTPIQTQPNIFAPFFFATTAYNTLSSPSDFDAYYTYKQMMDASEASDTSSFQATQLLDELMDTDGNSSKKLTETRSSVLKGPFVHTNEISVDSLPSSRTSHTLPQYHFHGLASTQTQSQNDDEDEQAHEGSQKENIGAAKSSKDHAQSIPSPVSRSNSPHVPAFKHGPAKAQVEDNRAGRTPVAKTTGKKASVAVTFQSPQAKATAGSSSRPLRTTPHKPTYMPSRYKPTSRPLSRSDTQDSFVREGDNSADRPLVKSDKFTVPLSELGRSPQPSPHASAATDSMFRSPMPLRRAPSLSPPRGRVLVEATPSHSGSDHSQDDPRELFQRFDEATQLLDEPENQAGNNSMLVDKDGGDGSGYESSQPGSSYRRLLDGERDPEPDPEPTQPSTQVDDSNMNVPSTGATPWSFGNQPSNLASVFTTVTGASSAAPSGSRSLMSMVNPAHRYRYSKYDIPAPAQPTTRNVERPAVPRTPPPPSLGPETQPSEIPTPSRSLPTPPNPSNPLDRPAPKSPSADIEVVPDSEPMAPEYTRNQRRPVVPLPKASRTPTVAQPKNCKVNQDEDVVISHSAEKEALLQEEEEEEEEEEEDIPLAAVTGKRTRAAASARRTQNKGKGKAVEAGEEEEETSAPTKFAAKGKATAAPVGKKPAVKATQKASALPTTSRNAGRSWETSEIPSSVPEQDAIGAHVTKVTTVTGVKPKAVVQRTAPRTRQASKAPSSRGKQAASVEDSEDEPLMRSDKDDGTEPADEEYQEEDADEPPRKRKRAAAKAPAAAKKTKAASKRGRRPAATPAAHTQAKKLRSVTGSSRANGAKGFRVFALWKIDGHYYPGVVQSETSNSEYVIAYDDRTLGTVTIDQLRRGQLRVGDEVLHNAANRSTRVVSIDNADNGIIRILLDDSPRDVPMKELKIAGRAIEYNFNDRLLTPDDIILPSMGAAAVKRPLSPSPSKSSMISLPAARAATTAPARGIRGRVLAKTGLIVTLNAEKEVWEKEKVKVNNAIRTGGGTVIDDVFSVIRMDGHFVDNKNNCYIFEQSEVAWIGDNDIERLFLVADEPNQKPKFLIAIALGIPCLSTAWLQGTVSDGQEREWIGYLLPQGRSAILKGRITQQIDYDWGESVEFAKRLPTNPIAAKLFANMHILCVGPQMVPQPKGKRREDNAETAKVVPRIILAMGAETVECVTEPRFATKELDDYNYIVIREPEQYVSELPPATTVDWGWVKECLIASRYFPVPTWTTAGEYSQEA
ncbi:unnamed protein product [Cyclocybe aegerita]|uniref:BRCT domain-containing protein n=1 Tax=Cyclocybe aegerita TaxID=1973307 RepID=A0A8S0WK38_CYCAE|nr:unnamed protein product [Cyclocybe aegerita]